MATRPATVTIRPATRPAVAGRPRPPQPVIDDLKEFAATVVQNRQKLGNKFNNQDLIISHVSDLQARLGDFPGAVATARELQQGGAAYLSGQLVALQTAAGDARGAAVFAKAAKVALMDDNIVALGTAAGQAETGNFAAARATLNRIKSKSRRADGYLDLVRATRDRRDVDEFVSLTRGSTERDTGRHVAEAQAWAGDAAAAVKTAQSLPKREDPTGALADVIHALAVRGDVQAAQQAWALLGKDDVGESDEACVSMVLALGAKGDVAGAKAAAERAATTTVRPVVGAAMAYAHAKAGDVPSARAVLAGLPQRRQETGCLGYGLIVTAQLERGDVAGARKTLADARTLIDGLRGKDKAEGAYSLLAVVVEGPSVVREDGNNIRYEFR